MKNLIISTLILAAPLLSVAAANSSYHCTPSLNQTPDLDMGPDGSILKINSVDIPSTQGNLKLVMSVNGLLAIDQANGKTQPNKMTLIYQLKERKSGTLIQLQDSNQNDFKFDGVYLEFGDINANSAGPIPAGTFDAKLSMAFIDSNIYYKNPFPMMVKKIEFNCKATFTY
jgi:hypothetical protein